MNDTQAIRYTRQMIATRPVSAYARTAVTPSRRTRHAELLRLCARIGYSPPGSR